MSEHMDTTPDLVGWRGDTLTGEQAHALGVGAVVRWTGDRSDGGLRMHTPTQGWVPALGSGSYVVVYPAPDLPRGYRSPAPSNVGDSLGEGAEETLVARDQAREAGETK